MTALRSKIETFNNSYGALATWIWRLVFYPLLLLVFYSGKSYLELNYVDKAHFDKAMSTLLAEKHRIAAEEKQELNEITGKLDSLLQSGAASSQRLTDAERRISRLEDKQDRAH